MNNEDTEYRTPKILYWYLVVSLMFAWYYGSADQGLKWVVASCAGVFCFLVVVLLQHIHKMLQQQNKFIETRVRELQKGD